MQNTHLKIQSCRALWEAGEFQAKSMFQEGGELRIMGGCLGKIPQEIFYPLVYVLFHVLNLVLKNLMNEPEVTRAIHQYNI